eukprot:4459028-Prymnesium_polylepis.1
MQEAMVGKIKLTKSPHVPPPKTHSGCERTRVVRCAGVADEGQPRRAVAVNGREADQNGEAHDHQGHGNGENRSSPRDDPRRRR